MSQAPPNPMPSNEAQGPGLDPAQQSLSDALRVSFFVLKVLMVGLLVIYVFSGIFRVKEGDTAVRYRFGEEIGIYGPGWHFGLPFPIENKEMVPTSTQRVNLNDSFWYNNPDDKSPEELANQKLDPLNDSFLITGDTNVIHVQFGVNFQIDPDRVDDYLRNVGSPERAEELVKTVAERAMIHYVASATIENIITRSKFENDKIEGFAQTVLDELETGLRIQQVLIDNNNQSMPNQVRQAYDSVTQAQADKARAIQEARRESNKILGDTAGGAHTDLLMMIRAYEWALASENQFLSEQLRSTIDRSYTDLKLPGTDLLSAISAYQDAAAEAAGTVDEQIRAESKKAADDLLKRLLAAAPKELTGRAISGQIASAINDATARSYEITKQTERDYNRYASDLATYQKTPRLLAATRLQETREKVLADVLVQTIVGPITRINTEGDPEVQNEISDADFQRRQEEARRKQEEEQNQ